MHLLAASLVVVLALAGLAAPPAAARTLASATWTTQITGYFGDSTFAAPSSRRAPRPTRRSR